MAERMDDGAYTNAVTGMGTIEMDKAEHVRASAYSGADLRELAKMKVQDGVAARIVESVPESALKHDISIIGDADGRAFKECSRKGLIEALRKAGEAQRLTGGAVIVTEYEDDTHVSEPPPARGKVEGYRVYSAGAVELSVTDFDGERPKRFNVRRMDGVTVPVSPERVAVVHGKTLPDVIASSSSIGEAFFGTGFLKPAEQAIKDLAATFGSAVSMAQENGLSIFRFDGLNQMMSRPGCGVDDLQKLMSVVKFGMSSMRAVYLGAGDSFDFKSHSFGGIPELLQKLVNRVSACCGIPVSILFGQSATGLAQTNEGDTKAFFDLVSNWRSNYLYRPAERLVADIARRNLGRDMGEFEWGSLYEMTDSEMNEAMAKQAEYLTKYIQTGVITPDEVRAGVFVNGHSFNISVDG